MIVESNLDVVGGLRSWDKVDTGGRKRNKAVCGFHATSSLMLQKRGKMRWCVGSMPPCLWCPWKEWKWGSVWTSHCLGSMWFPCHLIVDAAGRRENNKAACGFHMTLLGSRLILDVLLTPTPLLFPSSFTFSNYWLLSWLVSWQLSDWLMTWMRAMVGVLGQLRLWLSQDLAGDPKIIYTHIIRQESAPSRGS